MTTVRRLSPPDRRAPVLVARGQCPVGESCFCCPNFNPARFSLTRKPPPGTCPSPHPPEDRKCVLPYPDKISACPEQATMPQEAPVPRPGWRRPRETCCVECGRVTARRWTDREGRVLPWCAGLFPDPSPM